MVDSLRAPVERAAGLTFTAPPRSAHADQGTGPRLPDRQAGRGAAARRGCAGWRRPTGSSACFPTRCSSARCCWTSTPSRSPASTIPTPPRCSAWRGPTAQQLRLVLAHEMVHALQGQYLPLDSILRRPRNNDRLTAAQAILEGQATLASLDVLAPGQDVAQNPQFWELYRDQVRQQQTSMPVFARGAARPARVPDLSLSRGAEFMHWWAESPFRDTLPYGPRMPQSTEQILHPERYARGDTPGGAGLPPEPAWCTRTCWGERDPGAAGALAGSDEVQTVVPIGWGGDRFRVYRHAGRRRRWSGMWSGTISALARPVHRRPRGRRSAGRRGRAIARRAPTRSRWAGGRRLRYVLAPASWAGLGKLRRRSSVRLARSVRRHLPDCPLLASVPPAASACTAAAPPARPPACR